MILLSFLSSLMLLPLQDTSKKEMSYNLNEIVLTSSRIPKPIKDVPVVTRVIPQEVIKRNSGQSLISLLENEVPGLEFTQTEGITNNITFQGMGANYILVLIDGERIAGETSRSNPDFNRINLENIEKIEIIKGAMSTLYGSGAIAGVINIITKKVTSPVSVTLGTSFNGDGESKYSINAGGKRGKIGAEGNFVLRDKKRYFLDDYSSGAAVPFEVEGYENMAADIKGSYTSHNFSASLKGSYYNHERHNAGENVTTHDFYEDAAIQFSSRYKLNTDNYFELSHNYDNYSKYDLTLETGEKAKNYYNTINNTRFNYFTQSIKNNSVTTGLEILNEKLLTYQFQSGETNSATSGAAYIQDDYKISNKLTLQGGLRLEIHSEFGANITPKIAVMYKAGAFIFRTGYAGGFRSPSLKELYTDWNHMGLFHLVGNKNLKPETSNNFSFAAEYNKRNLNIAASIYHNRVKDKIATIWNSAEDTIYYSNVEKAAITGADLSFKWDIAGNFILRGYYAFVKDLNLTEGVSESSVRPHSVALNLERNFKIKQGGYSVILNTKYASGLKYNTVNTYTGVFEEASYNPYSLWNLGFRGTPIKGVSFYTGVNNLFNYRPEKISFNSYFSKGTTLFLNLSINLESLLKRQGR
jgi:outer membrane receptor for ferrienterochelin and colicins